MRVSRNRSSWAFASLGSDRTRNVVIVGAGNLGMALADYNGFHIVALVDADRTRKGAGRATGSPSTRSWSLSDRPTQSVHAQSTDIRNLFEIRVEGHQLCIVMQRRTCDEEV